MKDTSVDHARIARLVQRVFDEIGPIWAMLVEEGVTVSRIEGEINVSAVFEAS